jgi:hypothetical protein
MKLIKVMQGTVSCRVSNDDVTPTPIPPIQDMMNAIRARYQFAPQPQAGITFQMPGQTPGQQIFQGGKFSQGEEIHAITQLVMEQNGDVITSTSTDVADLIMNDFTQFLDDTFKYNFRAVTQHKSYVSAMIVQFDVRFEEKIPALRRILGIVNGGRGDAEGEFQMQRLSFGTGKKQQQAFPLPFLIAQSQIELIESAEFLIERRAGAPLSENRYFCSAPLRTADHVRTLEEIESVLSDE